MSKKTKHERKSDRIARIIPLDEIRKTEGYGDDFADLSEIFQHPIVEMKNRGAGSVWRWMPNDLQAYIMQPRDFVRDEAKRPFHIDLNDLCIAFYEKRFSLEEYMKWQMNEGYSLCGFGEIFGQRYDKNTGLDLIAHLLQNHKKPENKGKNWVLIDTPWEPKPFLMDLRDEDEK